LTRSPLTYKIKHQYKMKLTTRNQDPKNYIEATAILHKIGNQKPYFSLTGRVVENGRESVSGAIHKEILAAFPQLADIAALHLSDRALILDMGEIVFDGTAKDVIDNAELRQQYLAI